MRKKNKLQTDSFAGLPNIYGATEEGVKSRLLSSMTCVIPYVLTLPILAIPFEASRRSITRSLGRQWRCYLRRLLLLPFKTRVCPRSGTQIFEAKASSVSFCAFDRRISKVVSIHWKSGTPKENT